MSRLGGRRLRIAKHATERLFLHFQNQHVEIADHLKVSRQVVAEWLLRGYVSVPAAAAIDEMRIPGASKHELRPDVVNWDRALDRDLTMARSQNEDAYPTLPVIE